MHILWKSYFVTLFIEIHRCLIVVPSSYSKTVQLDPFRVFKFFEPLLDKILAAVEIHAAETSCINLR